jgi:hypothetical protein
MSPGFLLFGGARKLKLTPIRPCQRPALHLVSAPFATPFSGGRQRMQL